ncbi:MAG: class I SAM-dependent methyltransferase [Candidatus Dormibacteraeota bacterium]|nr:class I SAM-dependent methyltransferase [Candidatus Dormibacteraeota bacterium]
MQPHQRWERDRLASGLYAAGAARAWLGRPLARLLWRADVRRFYGERRRLLELSERSLVLDVPCGAGALFPRPRLSTGAGPCYVALDVSTLMLARARRTANARGLQRVHLVQADAHELPFVAGAFDLVVTHNGLHCYSEPARAVRELARVLKPGGVVRGSTIAGGAGRRPDLVIRAALRLGMFRSRLEPGDVAAWLRGAALEDVSVDASGAVNFFSARRP